MKKYPIVELVVKIASRCNLNCTYCYEYNMGDDTWKKASKFMSFDTAQKLSKRVNEHIKEFDLTEFSFGLHGGEPLLMSPEKLDELVCTFKSYIDKDVVLNFGLQSNATLITKEHIQVFKKHNIYISISLDGVEAVHNKNRVDLKGNDTWSEVISGIELLKKEAPELFVGLLSVIDIESDPIENFDLLSQFGVTIDFLLPLRNFDNPPFYPNSEALAYGKFYYKIYEQWVKGRNSHVDIRFIKNIITQLMGGQAIYEVMTTHPIGLLTINTDGFIEGVDSIKSIGSQLQVTNMHINDFSFNQALDHELVKMRQTGIDGLNEKCKKCKYLQGCSGGYLPDRYSTEKGFDNPSVYCDDLYWLLENIELDIKKKILHESVNS